MSVMPIETLAQKKRWGKSDNKSGLKVVNSMHRDDVRKIQVTTDVSIRDALKVMNMSAMETILVVDSEEKLVGLLSDGDIRRAILADIPLTECIGKIMNKNFTTVHHETDMKEIIRVMKHHYFKQLPLVDEKRRVVGIVLLKDIIAEKTKDNYVVLMAGGLGNRLKPLTENVPKPMLKIGDKPILEIIINQFKKYGFKNFIISINYKADIVEGYLGDGSDLDVNIRYVRETKRLGTAGCLKTLQGVTDKPFFVMNGDILTRLDFEDMMRFHTANRFDFTMGLRKYEQQIPYGVIETDGNEISALKEKPVNEYTINAGVYCLNPGLIEYIPEDEYFDITSLVEIALEKGHKIGGYVIKDYWTDIGRIEDYNKANDDYDGNFNEMVLPWAGSNKMR